jgi:hypothetical protein
MFVYALTEPIDIFDGLTPLPEWILADPVPRTRWALQVILALADTATQIRWNGDMRHLPSVGATMTPPITSPYLVVKQDNNGTTFVVADNEGPLPTDFVELRTEIGKRRSARGPTPPSPTSPPQPSATRASTRRHRTRPATSTTRRSDPHPQHPAACRCQPRALPPRSPAPRLSTYGSPCTAEYG